MKRVAFYTLGCKLNFSETSTIARLFPESEFQKVDFEASPDIFIINTCSVTDNADKKCKSLVNKARRISPHGFVAIIGCYAQLKPKEIGEIPGVDLVLGANEKFNILQHIQQSEKGLKAQIHACEIESVNTFIPSFSFGERTRAFFKIQDGCDYSCSFCTIPLARGKSRSESIEKTIMAAKALITETKAKEIVLTGVNTGDFGRHNGESFFELIQQLDVLEGVERFRISSIEPNLLSFPIIEFAAQSNKFVPHFHIPLQSGNNKTLKAMRRRYQRELYQEKVEKIKSLLPNACIGVDVIVGFPGETDEDFLDTYNFIQSLDISYLHVFTYSERDNTHAAELQEIVSTQKRAERSKMLHILSEKKKRYFYQKQIGKTLNVLWEAERDGDFMYGFTENYVKVSTPYNETLVNTIQPFTLNEINESGIVVGKMIESATFALLN